MATVERQWSTPSRPRLPSIQTAALKVWQIQSFCVMLYNSAQPQERPKESKRGRTKKTTQAEETSSNSDDEYIYLQETAQHLHRVKKIRLGQSQDTVLIRIGDIFSLNQIVEQAQM